MNAFVGGNASGKTSLLEAIYLLGRGRSFRAADNRVLIQRGQGAAEIAGAVPAGNYRTRLSIRVTAAGLEPQVDGVPGSVSDLVEHLPVQAIDADIGSVISEGPELRRRMIDWGVFHVEHHYLATWREYRRALNQRNAALRAGAAGAVLDAWEKGLADAGIRLDSHRRAYLQQLEPVFLGLTHRLLDADVRLDYRPGWSDGQDLEEALRAAREADRELGYTRLGPHRADLQMAIGTEGSRWRASRGQQKLLGAALVLALCRLAAAQSKRAPALLVDEPAADLDAQRLERLMSCLYETQAQIFVAAISPDGLALPPGKAMFHVEHGNAKALL